MNGQHPLKSLCFVVDQPGWAFDRWTADIATCLGKLGVHTTRCFQQSLPEVFSQDVICACWWPDVEDVVTRLSGHQPVLARVADMLTWNHNAPAHWQDRFARIAPLVSCFVASSEEIREAMTTMGVSNVRVVTDCVDPQVFRPDRVLATGEKATVGWCGNPRALQWMGFEDVKGMSVVEHLAGTGQVNVDIAADRPLHEMALWYSGIDILLCASRSEGTPLPVLEAMSAGKLVVSTPVGIVPEIDSPGVFLFDGSVGDLLRCLGLVLGQRQEWQSLGEANRACVLENYSPATAGRSFLDLLREQNE